MEDTGQRIVVPTLNEIVETNRLLIESTGGIFTPPNNLIYSAGLKWALEIIQCPFLFGNPIYPLLHDKAALLAWTIINDHVFLDGNKRTAMATVKIMALSNEYPFSAGDDEIIDVAHKIRDYRISGFTSEHLASWIRGCMHS